MSTDDPRAFEPWGCPACKHVAKSSTQLKKHVRKAHGVKNVDELRKKPELRLDVLCVCTNCGFDYLDGPQGQCDCDPKFIKRTAAGTQSSSRRERPPSRRGR